MINEKNQKYTKTPNIIIKSESNQFQPLKTNSIYNSQSPIYYNHHIYDKFNVCAEPKAPKIITRKEKI